LKISKERSCFDLKKALLIPYDNEAYSLLKYKNPNYDINSLVSPKGWGLNKKDSGLQAGDKANGIIINELEKEYEAVIIAQSNLEIGIKEYVIPKLKELDTRNKELVVLRTLNDEEQELLIDFSDEYKMNVTFIDNKTGEVNEAISLFKFATPIILVSSMCEGLGKFDVQLQLREDMNRKDIRISQIGTKSYSEFYGFNAFPDFMFDETRSNKNKIMMFNMFVKEIEMKEKPDAIVIGIPGGLIPISDILVEHFGELNFLVSKAVKSDSVSVVLPYNEYGKKDLDRLSTKLIHGFNYVVDSFVVSNKMYDFDEAEETGEKSSAIIDYDDYLEFFNNLDVDRNSTVDMHNNNKVSVCDCIIAALSEEDANEVI